MYGKRRIEDVNAKCKLLMEMGFEIEHADSRVSFKGFTFDFSATACDVKSIMYTALVAMHDQAFKQGKDYLREQFKSLMLPEEE